VRDTERRSGISRKVRMWRSSSDGKLEREKVDDGGGVATEGFVDVANAKSIFDSDLLIRLFIWMAMIWDERCWQKSVDVGK
jgi:hypothetical protein